MREKKLSISSNFVAVKCSKRPLEGTVEMLSDAGINYAVLPKSSLDSEGLKTSLPIFESPETGGFIVPTGKVTVRWQSKSNALIRFLEVENAVLERDYGKGGIVSSRVPVDPFEFARKLERVKGITKTEVLTLRRTQKK